MEFYKNNMTGMLFKPGTPIKLTAELQLRQSASYELYLTTFSSTGVVNGSLSIFIDSLTLPVLGMTLFLFLCLFVRLRLCLFPYLFVRLCRLNFAETELYFP